MATDGRDPIDARVSREDPSVEVSRSEETPWIPRAVLLEGDRELSERYRQAALEMRTELDARGQRAVLVTSAVRGEGKTTVACNLALALATLAGERRVALVDLDLRGPRVAASLGVRSPVGLERVFAGEIPAAEARIRTDLPALDLFLPSRAPSSPYELLASSAFAKAVFELQEGYDTIIIDCPPALLFPDVKLVLAQVEAWVPVVRSGVTNRAAYREMIQQLGSDWALGCFINDVRSSKLTRYYREYYASRESE